MIDWKDIKECGWERTPYGQLSFAAGPVELTLCEPDYTGRAELMIQVITPRKMSQHEILFPLPVEPAKYNEIISKVEERYSVSLAKLKWHS